MGILWKIKGRDPLGNAYERLTTLKKKALEKVTVWGVIEKAKTWPSYLHSTEDHIKTTATCGYQGNGERDRNETKLLVPVPRPGVKLYPAVLH